MKTKQLLIALLSIWTPITYAMGEDDPLIGMVKIHQLETRQTDTTHRPWILEADAWIGKDLDKIWLKTDIEWLDNEWEEAELQLLYSHALDPYWDMHIGWRGDFRPEPKRHWLAFGVHGLAPYHFEVDASVFVGKSGRLAARLQSEYEIMLTQRLVLIPDISINLYSKTDEALGIGAGLSDISAGLRLGYEIKREFTPYIGVQWQQSFGKTADFMEEGESSHDLQWLVGIRLWF